MTVNRIVSRSFQINLTFDRGIGKATPQRAIETPCNQLQGVFVPKQKTIFSCQQCGFQSPKWLGRCPDCNQWNTLVEEQPLAEPAHARQQATADKPQKLSEVVSREEDRISCGLGCRFEGVPADFPGARRP